MNADLVIKNGMVMTLDNKFTLYDQADVAITGNKIVDVVPQTRYRAKKTLNAAGKLVMPGLINAHTHSAMVMMRGLADDMPLDRWWNKFIFPIEKKLLNPEFVAIGAALAAVEMIKSGTTCFSDMYFFQQAAAEVCKKIGIRALLAEGIIDVATPDAGSVAEASRITDELYQRWQGDDLIRIAVGPHAPYSCGAECLRQSQALADKHDLPLHIHIAETAGEVAQFQQQHGQTPVEYLDKLGFLSGRVMAVHCVHLTPGDIEILRRADVKIVHCQESNMKLASGYAPVMEMQAAGLTVALGTDGAASNNNLDMFDEMDSVAKFHKLIRKDPTIMEARQVVKMATGNAARVIGREQELGSLEAGKLADLILIDLAAPNLTPLYNPYSHLVYSAGGSEVDTVIINGKLIMENRKILTADEQAIMARANRLAHKIKAEVSHG